MLFGVPGLTRNLIRIAVLIVAGVTLISCGNYSNKSSNASGLTFRAFVSNPLAPFGTATSPLLNIVDAKLDRLSPASVSVSNFNDQPGIMVLFPNRRFTLVFSASNNSVTEIDNAHESVAQGSSGSTLSAIMLPGFSESMSVGPDNVTGFAAVPTAPITGQSPGAVVALNLSSGGIFATLPVPGAHYIVQSHNGNRILVFGGNTDPAHCGLLPVVTVITPSLIGTSQEPRTFVCSGAFDHPVWAVFSPDDSTAYVLDCGPECSGVPGTTASITPLDMTTVTPTPGTPIPVAAATIGLLSGNTLYVAGTPSGTACGTCGSLQAVDVSARTVTQPVSITDGYHNRMEMGANGQLFVGASTCSNGCLSIFNTTATGNSSVVIPPESGDVTGLQPIRNRTVVYVCQNGALFIYDTATDKLQTTQITIHGKAVDVKLVD
jgi:hypothetical protein